MAQFLTDRLNPLREAGRFRELPGNRVGADFWSNDYLGFSRLLPARAPTLATSPGSRLISGDHDYITALEQRIAAFHGHPAALLFGSGYAANTGLISAIARRGDTLLYDALIHASIHDGMRLTRAEVRRCEHNAVAQWERALADRPAGGEVFVLTEARFSMDGDTAPLVELSRVCERYGAHLIVDEAHSFGLDGPQGAGMVAAAGLQERVFATVVTYGKAGGFHGAAVLGSAALRDYLINFSRPFIFTTAPRPEQVTGIAGVYDLLEQRQVEQRKLLQQTVATFKSGVSAYGLSAAVPVADGPIQAVIVPGNDAVMAAEQTLLEARLLVKGIRSPSVAAGTERLRICLHSFNTPEEIERLLAALVTLL